MQQKANMTVLGVSSTAEIVTVVNVEAKWQAVIVQDGKVLYRFGIPCDTKEDLARTHQQPRVPQT
jgi:hypothetical protein